jgi:hypothetical protein
MKIITNGPAQFQQTVRVAQGDAAQGTAVCVR